MANCQIRNNTYFAPNGNESILHRNLSEIVGESQAGNLFVLAYSDSFSFNNPNVPRDENGEPLASVVVDFARSQNENTRELTTAEKADLQVQFPNFETSDDLYVELEEAFYKDGLFAPTIQSLTRSVYSQFEAENLLSDINLLSQVKESIERLKHTDTVQNALSLDEEVKSPEINQFGKFKLLNPYIVEQDLIEEFGGIEDADVQDRSVIEDYARIPVIDDQGNPILNLAVYENGAKVIEQAENLTEARLADYGINTANASPIQIEQILANPTIENILALNENATQREIPVRTENKDRDLVYLETLKSEEQLFNELSLVHSELPNIYHRVEKVDEQEFRDFLQMDDSIPEYQLYKDYYGYVTPAKSLEEFTASPISTGVEYLKGDFVADFNAEILKNPTHEFYNKFAVNEKGIVLKYADPISLAQIEAYLVDGVKLGQQLADYSVISKNMPNFKQETFEIDERLWAVNNKNTLKKPTAQVTQIDRNMLAAKNETADFINYNGDVYELKNKEESDSVYMKLDTQEDLNYYQTTVGVQEYVDQIKLNQQNLEKYNSLKKLYKSADLEDNFNCINATQTVKRNIYKIIDP